MDAFTPSKNAFCAYDEWFHSFDSTATDRLFFEVRASCPDRAVVRLVVSYLASLCSDSLCVVSFFLLSFLPESALSRTTLVIISYPVERLHHDNRVPSDDTHAQSDLLVVWLAFGGFVEDNVQEDLAKI